MRNQRRAGFTLIEILIVVLVIGILLTVLGVRLFAARAEAQERTSQVYGSSVQKALTAVLASDKDLTAADVAAGTFNCGAGADATTEVTVGGETYQYGWGRAPANVTSCDVRQNAGTGVLEVEIATNTGTYLNGVPQ